MHACVACVTGRVHWFFVFVVGFCCCFVLVFCLGGFLCVWFWVVVFFFLGGGCPTDSYNKETFFDFIICVY